MIDRKPNSVRLIMMLCSLVTPAAFTTHADAVSHASTVNVYECVVDGQRIFSDQRCGPNAQSREITDSNHMAAQDTSSLSRHESNAKPRQSSDDTDKKKAACNKVREQQAQVESQRRTGYTATQGEHLRVRHDKLAERYASLKCERYR